MTTLLAGLVGVLLWVGTRDFAGRMRYSLTHWVRGVILVRVALAMLSLRNMVPDVVSIAIASAIITPELR